MAGAGNALEIVFWGILTFSILVVLHEAGHFFAARAFGVRVHEFIIGLPGPKISFKAKDTVYGVTAIPLGGYVKIAGMEPGPEDGLLGPALKTVTLAGRMDAATLAIELGVDRDRAASLLYTLADWGAIAAASDDNVSYVARLETTEGTDPAELLAQARTGTYRGLPTWKRIVVLGMGVIVNLATAILVFTVVLSSYGYYQQTLTISDVAPGSAAAEAGIVAGDTITEIDGGQVSDWMGLTVALGEYEPEDSISITVARDGVPQSMTIILGDNGSGAAYLGVVSGVEQVDLSVGEALLESISWIGLVFGAIAAFFDPTTFQQSVEGARSVVGISVEVAAAARSGPIDYAWWIALLSLSLGAMNLLPIPPLDGGKIAIEVIEKFMGRPMERSIALGISMAGALLLFSFIGYVMYADVVRYFVNT